VKFSDIIICPSCKNSIIISNPIKCNSCSAKFSIENNIPLMYFENNWGDKKKDVTVDVKNFYEETPFPDYENIDSISSLVNKSEKGFYAKFLNEQIPFSARVIEVGCGTGQLTNFLSIASRKVVGVDLCFNSLRLAENFRKNNNLENASFYQMNLFNPIFKEKSFDLVICQGVLHHTSDPYLGYKSIEKLVKPGGYIIIGLYNFYGRLITDFRRMIFNITGNRFKQLDPRLKKIDRGSKKRNSWFNDQYKHPHESKHTISEVLKWFDKHDYTFINAIPKIKPFSPITYEEKLFRKNERGYFYHHILSQLGTIIPGYKEGGLFIMIGRKNVK
tara:strand:+ start:660 stop:1652 length:993 start_codon:yes stop_codon:yes gene_type:complete